MIREDYVSFEVAKLLKEKGFDIECQCCYTPKGYIRNLLTDANNVKIQDFNSLTEFEYEGIGLKGWYGSISAPTIQMAMKWLRDTHKIFIEVGFNRFYGTYNVHIFNMIEQEKDPFKLPERFDSYEEACNEAIRYCLINLI